MSGEADPRARSTTRPAIAIPRWAEAASVLGLLALVAALAIRSDLRRPFSGDELFTYYGTMASGPAEIMEVLSSGGFDASPPLYDLAAWQFRRLIGNAHLACRLPSTLGYLTACGCLYAFARRRCPAPFAAVALLTLPASAESLMGSTARPYGLMLGLGCLAMVCWQAAAEGGRLRPLALLGLAASLAAGTANHYYAVLLLAPLGLAELARTFVTRRGRVNVAVWVAFAFAFAPLPFLLPLMRHSRELARGVGWLPVTRQELLRTFDDFTPQLVPSILAVGVLLARLGPFARTRPGAGRPARTFPAGEVALILGLLALPALGFAVGLAVTKAYTSRYVIAYLAGVALLMAYAATGLFRGRAGYGLVLVVAMLALIARRGGRGSGDWAWREDIDRYAGLAAASGRQLAIPLGDEYLIWHFYAKPSTAARMVMVDFAEAAHTDIFKNLNRWRVRKGLESFRIAEKDAFFDDAGQYYVYGRLETILQEGKARSLDVKILDYPRGGTATERGLFEVRPAGRHPDAAGGAPGVGSSRGPDVR